MKLAYGTKILCPSQAEIFLWKRLSLLEKKDGSDKGSDKDSDIRLFKVGLKITNFERNRRNS